MGTDICPCCFEKLERFRGTPTLSGMKLSWLGLGLKVAVTSVKLDIRLHAHPVGMNSRSGTEANFMLIWLAHAFWTRVLRMQSYSRPKRWRCDFRFRQVPMGWYGNDHKSISNLMIVETAIDPNANTKLAIWIHLADFWPRAGPKYSGYIQYVYDPFGCA